MERSIFCEKSRLRCVRIFFKLISPLQHDITSMNVPLLSIAGCLAILFCQVQCKFRGSQLKNKKLWCQTSQAEEKASKELSSRKCKKFDSIFSVMINHIFIIIIIIIILGIPSATLTSNPVEGTLCQRVMMTCIVHDIHSLNWYFDGTVVETYTYNSGDTYPQTIRDKNGIQIDMTIAMPRSPRSDNFNGTSILMTTILALNMLNLNNIRCGTNAVRSEEVDLTVLNVLSKLVALMLENKLN